MHKGKLEIKNQLETKWYIKDVDETKTSEIVTEKIIKSIIRKVDKFNKSLINQNK